MNNYNPQVIHTIICNYVENHLHRLMNEPFMLLLQDEDDSIILEEKIGGFDLNDQDRLSLLQGIENNNENSPINDYSLSSQKLSHSDLNLWFVIKRDNSKAISCFSLIKELLSKLVQEARALQCVQNNETFTSAMIDAVKAGMVTTDQSGNIIYTNKHICRKLKSSKVLLKNTSIRHLLPNWNSIYKIVSSGNIVKNEETIISTEQEALKFNIDVSTIRDKENTILGFCIIFRSSEKIQAYDNKDLGMKARYNFEDIIGKSKAIKQVIEYAQTISNSPSTILIEGESGTGKEVFAQSIHNASKRKSNSFVAINCAAIPENLIESELFGYDDGAFTGAKKGGQPGKFELANQGTLFLDEIGDMKPDMQAKLLRTIQESSVTRVGGERLIPVDVRIIAATNKNLADEVEKGNFRMDLYYRISVIPLHIPSLRERKSDLPSLIRLFLNKKSLKLQKDIPQMGYSTLQQLLDYDWPGNVRELENFIEQLVNFDGKISLDSFQKLKLEEQITTHIPTIQFEDDDAPLLSLKDMEKNHIIKTLRQHNGNMSRTSKTLGISRNTLYLKLKKYEINPPKTQLQ